jgi:superfamily II DNA or RNA helicase/HKD family nuclease
MSSPPEPGLWELLVTERLATQLEALTPGLHADLTDLRNAEAADRLSRHVAALIARLIDGRPERERSAWGAQLSREVIRQLAEMPGAGGTATDAPVDDGRVLEAVLTRLPTGEPARLRRPLTPLLDTTLLTNAPGEPVIAHELQAEIDSATAIDVVMAFIRRSGILQLLPDLRRHCEAGRSLRVLTTTYTGSTEARALDDLADLGAQVRVSYETGSTRLHAKAWVFHRAPTTTTAYLGSSNLTHTAQHSGLEWNVRLAAARNPDVIAKMGAVFESYWVNGDFVDYEPDEFRRRMAIGNEPRPAFSSPLAIELRPYQEALLEQLALARHQGHHRNLLVAATGTGKTVMAAVDYQRLRRKLPRARLLFVAHREEILIQSRATFAQALRDPAFGELWVRGERPVVFDHTFASVQSLAAAGLDDLPPDHYDVVVVDEFHHAEAATYRRLLDHVRPVELVGLTATPERADGLDVLARFDGRIAAELRLWDAISGGYLVPFAYYGVADGTDLSRVPWRRGRGYDPVALTGVLTADHAWAHLVIAQVRHKVTDPRAMRALGFCVSIEHARFMAERFREAGIPAVAVWGGTAVQQRRDALRDLIDGRVAVVFTVDLFNEGIDIPEVDTLLMLRPTESGTLFIQQLGRGLRRADGKSVCTVLDFVGQHRREFRYDQRFRALLGGVSRRQLQEQIEQGFPFLPSGASVALDPVAQAAVLRSIRESLPSTHRARVAELRSLGDVDLATFLHQSGLELEDVYASNRSWTTLRRAAGLPTQPAGPEEESLLRAIGRLTHVDDPDRLAAYREVVASCEHPVPPTRDERATRLARMLIGSVADLPMSASVAEGALQLGRHPQVRSELAELLGVLSDRITHLDRPLGVNDHIPLRIHARYTRRELLAAFGCGSGLRAPSWQEGVRWLPEIPADLFAFTLDKTAGSFSPTTRYRDYALSPDLLHWESQSATSVASPTGQRYLNHAERDSHVILFGRLDVTQRAFWCLGPATYVRHEGDRPIAITWRLQHRLPADLYAAFAAAVA